MAGWDYETQAREKGYTAVCGCDEAGAGPLAGPVYAGAVILPFGVEIPGLDDSKKLTEKRREALFPVIQELALAWAVAKVDAEEIDRTDILSARMKAMQLAIDRLSPPAGFRPHRRQPGPGTQGTAITTEHRMIVKGDRPVGVYRGSLHIGQGEPGPLDGPGGGGVPPVPV